METNLKNDNKSELNKIFLIYASLDMQAQAEKVYLDYMITQHAPTIYFAWRPTLQNGDELESIKTFFDVTVIDQSTDMIAKEVRIGVPSGRIIDVMGSEVRFKTASQLIYRFLNEYYRGVIREYLDREKLLPLENGTYLLLSSIQIVI